MRFSSFQAPSKNRWFQGSHLRRISGDYRKIKQARYPGTAEKRIANSGDRTDGIKGTDRTDETDGTDGTDGIDGTDRRMADR